VIRLSLCHDNTFSIVIMIMIRRHLSHKLYDHLKLVDLVVVVVVVKVKVKVILRPSVSRPVRPGVSHTSGDQRPIFPILSLIIFRQFRVCWCGAPSLTRSRVFFNFCRASPAQPISDLSPTGLLIIVHCLYFWGFPTWRARFLYLFPPGTGQLNYTLEHNWAT
jgi:hypothetical protein